MPCLASTLSRSTTASCWMLTWSTPQRGQPQRTRSSVTLRHISRVLQRTRLPRVRTFSSNHPPNTSISGCSGQLSVLLHKSSLLISRVLLPREKCAGITNSLEFWNEIIADAENEISSLVGAKLRVVGMVLYSVRTKGPRMKSVS